MNEPTGYPAPVLRIKERYHAIDSRRRAHVITVWAEMQRSVSLVLGDVEAPTGRTVHRLDGGELVEVAQDGGLRVRRTNLRLRRVDP